MVFRYIRLFPWDERKSAFDNFRVVFLQYLQSGIIGNSICGGKKHQKNEDSVSSVFDAGRSVAGVSLDDERRCQASFTVEAALVLTAVFLTLALIIEHAYVVHDQVTGGMILEETVEKIRYRKETGERTDELRMEGECRGSPRLWLGDYGLQIKEDSAKIDGKASAGDWSREIEMKRFEPEQFLRRYQALTEIGEWIEENGN